MKRLAFVALAACGSSSATPDASTPDTAIIPDASPDAPSTIPTDPITYPTDEPFAIGPDSVYVPPSYDPTHYTPIALLVWLHGCGGNSPGEIYNVSLGGAQSWIALAPGGADGGCWDVDHDPARVLAAIDALETHFNIARHRIVIGGYSSGGDLAYRTAFYNADRFAGLLAENTSPFRDTGSSQSASLAAATWKFPIVHLAHLQDTTYPIATVHAETAAVTTAGFPLTLIERDGGHYDNANAVENSHPVPGTVADMQSLLLPHMDDGWTSP